MSEPRRARAWGYSTILPLSEAARADMLARMNIENATLRLYAVIGADQALADFAAAEVSRRAAAFTDLVTRSLCRSHPNPHLAAIDSVYEDIVSGRIA